MPTMKIGAGLAAQLKAGASILAAAQTVDTRAIERRLAAFARADQQFRDAQERVGVLAMQLTLARRQLRTLDAEQGAAADTLAAQLSLNGWPRLSPFAAFGVPPPSALARLPFAAEARTIHQLAAAVMRTKGVTQATRQAAQRADTAAAAVERGLRVVAKLETVIRVARHQRDAKARHCRTAVAVLKLSARAAANGGNSAGAPTLYAALFERPKRPVPKRRKRPPAPAGKG